MSRIEKAIEIATRKRNDHFMDADTWAATVPRQDGSWWVAWAAWLASKSSGERSAHGAVNGSRPPLPPPLCDAPGTYVHEK